MGILVHSVIWMCAPAVSYIAANVVTSIAQALLLARIVGLSALLGALLLNFMRIVKFKPLGFLFGRK